MTQLNSRLGLDADQRVVIVNADDLGLSQSANDGVFAALRDGAASSASLMVPCPWSRHAAAEYRGEDVGVHLTLIAEFDAYRWGPITHAPSLLDGDGGFPRTVADLWDHADLDEVRREARAQIERAVLWGFDLTHLDSHKGALVARPEFFDVYVDLALEFRLPIRLPAKDDEDRAGFPFRSLAADEGLVFPDHLVMLDGTGDTLAELESAIAELEPGVTELTLRPATDTPELRAITPQWRDRVDDLTVATRHLPALLAGAGVHRIGWRPLQSLVQAG